MLGDGLVGGRYASSKLTSNETRSGITPGPEALLGTSLPPFLGFFFSISSVISARVGSGIQLLSVSCGPPPTSKADCQPCVLISRDIQIQVQVLYK